MRSGLYKCMALVFHLGDETGGHYTAACFVRRPDTQRKRKRGEKEDKRYYCYFNDAETPVPLEWDEITRKAQYQKNVVALLYARIERSSTNKDGFADDGQPFTVGGATKNLWTRARETRAAWGGS